MDYYNDQLKATCLINNSILKTEYFHTFMANLVIKNTCQLFFFELILHQKL